MLLRLLENFATVTIMIILAGLLLFYEEASNASPLVSADSRPAYASDAAMPHPLPAAAVRVPVPAGLETPESVQAGAHLFRENCAQCHGAPGIASPAQGMNPAPPNLLLAGRRNDPAEIFPKIKNGIPGTAMPAWGAQLPDRSIWALAAFLHQARGIPAGAFDALSTTKAAASSAQR